MKWFKHDTDANMDAKLRRVRLKYGMAGYGLYWYCLELIASNVDQNNITFELEHDVDIISADTGIGFELVHEMMTFMVNQGLFEESGGIYSCIKMMERLDKSMTSNSYMRELIDEAKKSHDKIMINHDSVMTKSGLVMQDKIRLDENRLEKKNIRAAKRVPPKWQPSEECIDFALNQGMLNSEIVNEQLDAFRDHEFKTARKDWDACWRTWCRNFKKWGKDETRNRGNEHEANLARLRTEAEST